MAYNHFNKLHIIKQVQEVYTQHKQEGISTMWVYRKHIYPRFFISRTTFYTYLSTPAAKLLKEGARQSALWG